MAPANQQVITAYEECNMSPEDIATDLGYELAAVKMILLQHSQSFSDAALSKANKRAEEGVSDEVLFGKSDLDMAKQTMRTLCAESEIETVRFRAAEFIINEAKGRNDLRALKDNKFNIVMINDAMKAARVAIERAKRKAIDVESTRKNAAALEVVAA